MLGQNALLVIGPCMCALVGSLLGVKSFLKLPLGRLRLRQVRQLYGNILFVWQELSAAPDKSTRWLN